MHKALDRSLILAAAAAFMLMTAGCATPRGEPTDYAAVLSDGARPEADRARDAARRTDEVLAFAQVRPGQSIGDMIIGGGYFTRVFASAVGDSGRVVAWQPAEFIAFQASYGESLTAVDEAHENVTAIRSSIGAPEFPGGMDLIFTAQNYHDLHLQPFPAETAARVNAAVFQALKPGGLYVIIDHAALPGAGLTVANTLHRIDIADVRREVEAAGFVLDAESDILLNDADALTVNVFDEAIRGRTSQFMLRFRKPA
jgi:predicted methyltransferase